VQQMSSNVFGSLRQIAGFNRVLPEAIDVIPYGFDGTAALKGRADCVVLAEPTMEVSEVMDYSVVQQCMHYGKCLPTCPTYEATKRERLSPRGRFVLLRAVADDGLSMRKDFAEELDYCLGCLA